MNKSTLKQLIKEEIINILSEEFDQIRQNYIDGIKSMMKRFGDESAMHISSRLSDMEKEKLEDLSTEELEKLNIEVADKFGEKPTPTPTSFDVDPGQFGSLD